MLIVEMTKKAVAVIFVDDFSIFPFFLNFRLLDFSIPPPPVWVSKMVPIAGGHIN